MWRQLYAFYLAVIEAADNPERLDDAEDALESFLDIRRTAATGKWTNWYRGDNKVNVPALLEKTREARRRSLTTVYRPAKCTRANDVKIG